MNAAVRRYSANTVLVDALAHVLAVFNHDIKVYMVITGVFFVSGKK